MQRINVRVNLDKLYQLMRAHGLCTKAETVEAIIDAAWEKHQKQQTAARPGAQG